MSSSTSELIKSQIVRAGAGAGKTRRLTNEVLRFAKNFYQREGQLPRIVVTTFTRKATEELKERLLQQAVKEDDDVFLQFVTSESFLCISTIHGVLSLFLRRFGQMIKADPNFSIIEEDELRHQSVKILRRLLVDSPEHQKLLAYFSVSELVDIMLELSDMNIRSLSARPIAIGHFVAALQEQRDKHVERLTGIAEFVSSIPAIQESAADIAALAKWMASIDVIEINKHCDKFEKVYGRLPVFSKKWGIEKVEYSGVRDFFKKELIFWSTDSANADFYSVFLDVNLQIKDLGQLFAQDLTEFKVKNGQITMADLESLATDAVRQFPQAARAFASEWDYWLIDEFQDTSPLQVNLLTQITGNRPKFVVGDPQQSIYLFRGARSEVFENYEKAVVQSGGLYEELPINYRSQPELLQFFNDFFVDLDSRFWKMQPRENDLSPDRCVAFFATGDETEPYGHIIDHIRLGLQSGEQPGDYCILARTNNELFQAALALEKAGLSTYMHSSDGFYDRREVLDLLSILKFTLNPHDNLNFIRLFRSPWLKIDDSTLAKIANVEAVSMWRSAEKYYSDHPAVLAASGMLEQSRNFGHVEALRRSIVDLEIIDFSHYHDPTGRREANIWKFVSMLMEKSRAPGFSALQFVDRALESWKSVDGDEENDAVAATEPNRVQLMTIHKSKGLSFKHVILLNMHKAPGTTQRRRHKELFVEFENGLDWSVALRDTESRKIVHNIVSEHHFAKLKERELQESTRVLYVALTRATDSVFLHSREKIAKGSWAERVFWPSESGISKKEKYSYCVIRERQNVPDDISKNVKLIRVRPKWSQIVDSKARKRISVTKFLEDANESTSPMKQDEPIEKDQLFEQLVRPVRGTKIHEVFERMRLGQDFDAQMYLETWLGDSVDQYSSWIENLVRLESPPLVELLKSGEVEWGFQLRLETGTLEGQIDLWGQCDDDIWVIDYKTGHSRYSSKAIEQLKIYSYAISKHLKAQEVNYKRIRMAALFASDGQIVTAEFDPSFKL